MWLELPNLWVGLLNGLGIPAAHFGISWLYTKMPLAWFPPATFPYRPFPGETAKLYDRLFRLRSWKSRLPDAGPWFGGFAKSELSSADTKFLARFRAETCRSEAAHWAQVIVIAAFIIWTPWPWAIVILCYSVVSNLPCIILQRQNRLRLDKVLGKRSRAT
jgi:glycosyl-4,4'-diaponeurosporenoate acyltransferase